MGKRLIIKGADFSANGFIFSPVDYNSYQLGAGAIDETGKWATTGAEADNKHIIVSIPSGASKLVVDATTIQKTAWGKTATQEGNAIICFLTGTPASSTHQNGDPEATFISSIEQPIGSINEVNIPSNATKIAIHVGYWASNDSYLLSRLPIETSFE